MTGGQKISPPLCKSLAKKYDVFISYASEDREYTKTIADRLRTLGLTIFLDEYDLIAGKSLRGQIDHAISNARFGLLLISHFFLRKRWPTQEFDAFFTLEADGNTSIIPVMLGIRQEEIRTTFPILASRFALTADNDPEKTAQEILRHVEKILSEEGSWAQLVRIDTLCLPWVSRPMFFQKSLKILDDHFPTFWLPHRKVSDIPGHEALKALRVGDVIEGGILYDGCLVAVTGRQTMVQLYEQHRQKFDEYVCQISTNHPAHRKSLIYTRYALPTGDVATPGENQINNAMPFELPRAPDGYLTTVVGVVIATGAMRLTDDSIGNAAYIVAAKIHHAPQLNSGS
jgi:hypothetical protein